MKRLLFAAPGILTLAVFSGCGTQTGPGPLKGPDGTAMTTPSGAQIVVVDPTSSADPQANVTPPNGSGKNPPANAKSSEAANDSTYKERLDAAKKEDAKPVQIQRSDAEIALLLGEVVERNCVAEIRRVYAKDGHKGLKEIVVYVDSRVYVVDEAIKRATPKSFEDQPVKLTNGIIVALRSIIEKKVSSVIESEIAPKIVKSVLDKTDPAIREAVTKGDFAKAREIIWWASTTGIPTADDAIRVKSVELMHGLVNPANWQKVEPEINKVTEEALASKKFDAGIESLQKLEVSVVVREYSLYIDRRLDAVKAELVKIGVAEADMAEIMDAQTAIIAAAAKIVDIRDEYKTLEEARKEEVTVAPRKDPQLAEYYKKLDEFHDVLVRYNCTKDSAEKIVTDLDNNLLALIKLLRASAKVETRLTGEKRALQLGTRSLNNRIHALVKDSVKKLLDAKDKAEQEARSEQIKKSKSDLERQVRELIATGKFEEARELIWNAAATGDIYSDTEMFTFGLSLLRDLVNPSDWARIEKDINATFEKLSEKGDFEELAKFLKEYPRVRQHTVKLDEQLARVKAEAEALGADEKKAMEIAKFVCENMVSESEQLVDHLDKLVADAAAAGGEVDRTKFQKELDIYAVKLAAYHATPENVKRIVEKLRSELDALIAKPENKATTHLTLGTNAVNDRIKALTEKLLASIQDTKKAWQDREHARIVTDLEKRVRAAVKEGRFDDARNYIRDEKLIGRKDLDLSLYELRVGLLDSCVNPAQLDSRLAEIEEKLKAFAESEDYEGALKYIENYPYVHDQYEEIDTALAAVKAAMLALEISPNEAEKDEKVRFFESIQELLEKRSESWKPKRDLSVVEKAISEVAKALFNHINKHPELIESERKSEYEHILADIAALDRTITTWELNQRLQQRLGTSVEGLKKSLAIQSYAKQLVKIDAEVSFDSQIAMAEEAISRQLGVTCDRASFKVNALLGEYARVFRLAKKTGKIGSDQATTMLLGAAYLDQPQVLKHALDLGADVNGISPRDPRGRTALALAVDTGHSGLVGALVKAGADLSATDKDGNAIIHYAAKAGNLSVLKAVVAGAPVNVKNSCGNTPLAIAVVRNQPSVVTFLVESVDKDQRSAFVDSKNKEGDTAFDIAAKCGSRDVLDALAAAGATYSTKDLILAEKADHVAVAQWLVNQGLDVNAEGVMAAACPKTRTGRYLVNEGGVSVGHSCKACAPDKADAEKESSDAAKPKCECKPVPVDVLLVPQSTK